MAQEERQAGEPDNAGDHDVPAKLVELHEALEYGAAVAYGNHDHSTPDAR